MTVIRWTGFALVALFLATRLVTATPDFLSIEFERVDGEVLSLAELVASEQDADESESQLTGLLEYTASSVYSLEQIVAENGQAPRYGALLIDLRARLERLLRDLAGATDPGRRALASRLAPEVGVLLAKLVQEITGRLPTRRIRRRRSGR